MILYWCSKFRLDKENLKKIILNVSWKEFGGKKNISLVLRTSSSEKAHSVFRNLLSCIPWIYKELCLKRICFYYRETKEVDKKITLSFGYKFKSDTVFQVEERKTMPIYPQKIFLELIY